MSLEADDLALDAETFGDGGFGGGPADNLPDFFKHDVHGGPGMLPPGGEPGLGGLEGELGDDEDLAFGDAFDMPLAGLPEFFTSTDGTEPPEGGDVIAAQMEAAAEYDMLAEITGEESGARAALGLAPAASGAAVYAAPAPAAAPGGGDAGGWGNLGQLQAAYLQKWQQQQARQAAAAAREYGLGGVGGGALGDEDSAVLSAVEALGLDEEGMDEGMEDDAIVSAVLRASSSVSAAAYEDAAIVSAIAIEAASYGTPAGGEPSAPVGGVLTAEQLEAELAGTAPASYASEAAGGSAPAGGAGAVPMLQAPDGTMVPLPLDWTPATGDVPEGFTLVWQPAAAPPMQQQQQVQAPLMQQQQVAAVAPSRLAMPPSLGPQAPGMMHQPMMPQGPAPPMAPMGMAPPPQQQQQQLPLPPHFMPAPQQLQLLAATRGMLAPHVFSQAQAAMAHMMAVISQTPGGLAAMPPAARAQFQATQGVLQAHGVAMQAAGILNQALAAWQRQMQQGGAGAAQPAPSVAAAAAGPPGGAQPPLLPAPAPSAGAPPASPAKQQPQREAGGAPRGSPGPAVGTPGATAAAAGSKKGWSKPAVTTAAPAPAAAPAAPAAAPAAAGEAPPATAPAGRSAGLLSALFPTPAEAAKAPAPAVPAAAAPAEAAAAAPAAKPAAPGAPKPAAGAAAAAAGARAAHANQAARMAQRGGSGAALASGVFVTPPIRGAPVRSMAPLQQQQQGASSLMGPGPAFGGPRRRAMPIAPGPGMLQTFQPGLTLATVLSRSLPPPPSQFAGAGEAKAGAGGRGWSHMRPSEVLQVARMMYVNIAASGLDPFAECYYHFALKAKHAAAEARARSAAPPLPPGASPAAPGAASGAESDAIMSPWMAGKGNALDAAVTLLTSLGTSAAAAAAGPKKGAAASGEAGAPAAADGKAAEGSVAHPPLPPTANDAAAAAALTGLPLESYHQRNIAANRAELKRIAQARRRTWETQNHVLGRIVAASIKTPKQVLNLSTSGTTTAQDIRKGALPDVGKQVVSLAQAREVGSSSESSESASPAGGDADVALPLHAAVDSETAPAWLSRSRVDAVLEAVLRLQDAARKLQAHLRIYPPPPQDVMAGLRADVIRCRSDLAFALGLGGKDDSDSATATAASASGSSGDAMIDDGAVLSLLYLPKGKRTLIRAVTMLAPAQRQAAVTAGLRHIPQFVASPTTGKDADEADAALAGALTAWIKTLAPAVPGPSSALGMLDAWLQELQFSQPGRIIRALLQHPGASEAISALLFRGEAEAAAVAAVAATAPPEVAPALEAAVSSWRATTEAVGRAFVEADQ